jgi:C4-type Zn-finger protein
LYYFTHKVRTGAPDFWEENMFIIWGSIWKVRELDNSNQPRMCPFCHTVTEFKTIQHIKYLTYFWVPLFVTDKEESLQCSNCGHYFVEKENHVKPTHMTIPCYFCAQKMRVPYKESKIEVTCPKCRGKQIVLRGETKIPWFKRLKNSG